MVLRIWNMEEAGQWIGHSWWTMHYHTGWGDPR